MTPNSKPFLLMVEDDLQSLLLMQKYLEDSYITHAAVSAEEAITLIKKNNYSGFLIDIKLSTNINGIELMLDLRNLRKYSYSPIIAVTAFFSSSDINYLKEVGFDEVIIKPFRKNDMLNSLAKYFDFELKK